MAKLREVANAISTRTVSGSKPATGASWMRTLSDGKRRGGGRGEVVHAANQLPANAVFLRREK
jgi:hypothetical protein